MTVKIGQVYKDRDRRTTNRHFKVVTFFERTDYRQGTQHTDKIATCQPCREDGTTISERTTFIKCKRLELKSKFELVHDVVEVDTETAAAP